MRHIYILQCNDGSFYTGITDNVSNRLKRHNAGKGSKYTKDRRPVELVYTEQCSTESEARNRESEIKSYSRKNKERLIKYGESKRFPSALKT